MASEVLYKKIYHDLLSSIRSGEYPVGTRLPSELQLADSYGVSRITSKKALEMLANRGLVFRRPGKGTFVTAGNAQAVSDEDDADEAAPSPDRQPLIGVIFDGIDSSFGLQLLNGVEYECSRRNMLMMFRQSYGSIEIEKKALTDMLKAGVSGVILLCAQAPAYDPEVLKLYLEGFPMILVDREMKGVPIPVVCTDNYTASAELTGRLIGMGHRHIGYISHSHVDTSTIARRFDGFCEALRQAGVSMDNVAMLRDMDAYIPKDDDEEVNIQMYRKELSDFVDANPDVTAFYAVEFSIARLLYQVLEEKGLTGKKDLVYFDGFANQPAPLSKRLHIMQDQYQIGVTAVRYLAHRMRGEQVPDHEFIQYIVVEPS